MALIRRTYLQAFIVLLLIFLAYSRFIAGGNILNPESSVRGLIEVGLVSLALLLAFLMWGKKAFLIKQNTSIIVPLLLFGIFAAISTIWSPNHLLTLGKAYGLIAITISVYGLVTYTHIQGISLEKLVLHTVIVFLIILFLLTLIQFGTLLHIDWTSSRPRLSLVFDHPNIVGSYFAVGLLLCFHLFTLADEKKDRRGYFFLGLIFSVLLFLTDARAEMGAVVIAVLVMILLSTRVNVLIFIGCVAGAILFVPLIFLIILKPEVLITAINNYLIANPDILTLNGRVFLWTDIVSLLPSISLWGGVGFAATRYLLLVNFVWGSHAHNTFLEVLLGTGLVGVFFLLGFYISALFIVLRKPRKYIFPLAILVYGSVTGLFSATLFLPGFSMVIVCLFIFQSAIHSYLLDRDPNKSGSTTHQDRRLSI